MIRIQLHNIIFYFVFISMVGTGICKAQSTELNYLYKKTILYTNQQAFDSANKYIAKAEKQALQEDQNIIYGCISYFKADNYYYAENFKEALNHYHTAVRYLESSDSVQIFSYAMQSIGIVYMFHGEYEKAKIYLQRNLKVAKDNELSQTYAHTLENLGLLHMDLGDHEHTVSYLSRALEQYQIFNDSNDIARIYQNIGVEFAQQNEHEKAFANYFKSLNYYIKLNDQVNVANAYNNIALVHHRKKEFEKAIHFYTKSLALLEGLDKKRSIAFCLSNLAELHGELYEEATALGYLTRSTNIAIECNLKDLLESNYRILSNIYAQKGEFKKAYDYHVLYKSYTDSLINEHNIEQIAEIEEKFENKEKQKEIENLRLERTIQKVKNRRSVIIFFLSISIVVILLLVVSWFYRIKSNHNKILQNEIQERIKAEQALKRLTSELEKKILERTLQLQKAKEKAEESEKLKTSFLANMSHEIRTPMNGILGFTEMLAMPNVDSERKSRYIKLIDQNSNVLLNLIEDIIDVSNIESGNLEISYEDVNYSNILIDLYRVFKEELNNHNKKQIDFVLNIPENVKSATLVSDPARLQQVISILLHNAIKFTTKGSIEFGCKFENKSVRFFIKDTGIGIAPENQIVIFNRFRQIDESDTRKYGGTGIGLYIAKHIVECLNGTIALQSGLNKGSEFYFDLPISPVKSWYTSGEEIRFLVFENDMVHYENIKQALSSVRANIKRVTLDQNAGKHIEKEEYEAVILHIDDFDKHNKYLLKEFRSLEKPVFLISSYKTLKSNYTQLSELSKNIFAKPINKKAFQKSLENML